MADNTKMVTAYLRLRDTRTALLRKFEEEDGKLKSKQELLEMHMLQFLNSTGTDSVKTPIGTFYKQTEIKPAGADWQTIYEYIKDNDAFEMLERRIKKTFVQEYMEANDGAIPPGVTVHREYVVRVRRGDGK